ncbi:MAG: sugar ABC transporter ATP-binding protein [Chloroflexi bacterium]|mgnify:CR=1 FL=1|nr:sugar ABC transporter ATP-binding protein [Chloroflexota bacterium]
MEESEVRPLLEMRGISKVFPGVQALSDMTLSVMPGEIHGLVGKNGAGKSTLMAVLMGLIQPDSGTMVIDGRQFTAMTPAQALEAGVAYVPQRINLMTSLTVAENILAGQMPTDRFGFVRWDEAFKDAAERLEKLGLKLDVYQRVEGLSVAEQTLLAISKALFSNARLIILDEPTAALPRPDINRLFGFVRSLKDRGVAFIYISHHLEEVFEICDNVTVLRNGRLVGTYPINEIDTAGLIRAMVGEDVEEYQRKKTDGRVGEPVLELKNMVRRGHYEDVNLTVRKGEVVGIAGLEGCGASALAKSLFGLDRRGLGEVTIKGKPYTATNPSEALAQGLAYLPQDRYLYGLVGGRPVRENITYTVLDRLCALFGFVRLNKEREIVAQYIEKLGIVTPSQEQAAALLSGGNQQKVVFAKLAATKPDVLVLHEPTQGIDVHAKTDIYQIVSELSEDGIAILIISSEVRELLGVCDRILVMYQGKIHQEFRVGDPNTTPQNILLAIEGANTCSETAVSPNLSLIG